MHGLLDIPSSLVPLSEFLAGRLGRVGQVFDDHLASDLPPVARLVEYVERYRGKMLRPSLVLLAGLAAHPRKDLPPEAQIGDEHDAVAAVCEMVHMATLVHDDVLDEAQTRRRGQTVNSLRGNEAAVILGDHLIASAYHLCSLRAPRASVAVARASVVMCAGELLQLHNRGDWSLDEATYFEIIRRKTGELIATAAQLGAECSEAPAESVHAVRQYAMAVGTAFQIQDDLLDLMGSERVVGKSVGKDLEKAKLTLPLIHHLSNADPRARGRTLMLLDRIVSGDTHAAAEVAPALRETDSIAAAHTTARELVQAARGHLKSLPQTPARAMLELMADAVVTRTY